jgi:hypothetical protein
VVSDEAILTERITEWATNLIASPCDSHTSSDRPRSHFCAQTTTGFPFLEALCSSAKSRKTCTCTSAVALSSLLETRYTHRRLTCAIYRPGRWSKPLVSCDSWHSYSFGFRNPSTYSFCCSYSFLPANRNTYHLSYDPCIRASNGCWIVSGYSS